MHNLVGNTVKGIYMADGETTLYVDLLVYYAVKIVDDCSDWHGVSGFKLVVEIDGISFDLT